MTLSIYTCLSWVCFKISCLNTQTIQTNILPFEHIPFLLQSAGQRLSNIVGLILKQETTHNFVTNLIIIYLWYTRYSIQGKSGVWVSCFTLLVSSTLFQRRSFWYLFRYIYTCKTWIWFVSFCVKCVVLVHL